MPSSISPFQKYREEVFGKMFTDEAIFLSRMALAMSLAICSLGQLTKTME